MEGGWSLGCGSQGKEHISQLEFLRKTSLGPVLAAGGLQESSGVRGHHYPVKSRGEVPEGDLLQFTLTPCQTLSGFLLEQL